MVTMYTYLINQVYLYSRSHSDITSFPRRIQLESEAGEAWSIRNGWEREE